MIPMKVTLVFRDARGAAPSDSGNAEAWQSRSSFSEAYHPLKAGVVANVLGH
jgi:hypothetical protein